LADLLAQQAVGQIDDLDPNVAYQRELNNLAVSTVATVARPWGTAGPPSGDGG
jgi:hypothetical protein